MTTVIIPPEFEMYLDEFWYCIIGGLVRFIIKPKLQCEKILIREKI